MDERRFESKAGQVRERAQEQVERLTGRSMDAWTRDARHYVREHPLQAVALTIGLGFVLGKILGRD